MATDGPMPDPASGMPSADKVEELIRTGHAVLAEIGSMAEDSGNQFVSLARRAADNQRLIGRVRKGAWLLAASVAVDIALSVVLGLGLIQIHSNEQNISTLTDRVNKAQTVTRRATLCPLYGVLLSAENPKSRVVYPQGPAAYDKAFAVIRQGYQALGCQQNASSPQPVPSISG